MPQTHDEEDFGALFEQDNVKPRKRVNIGDKVSGTVMFLGASSATVDLGDGLDALLDLAGLLDKDGKPTIKPGDRVDAIVVRFRDRVVELAKTITKGHANLQALNEAAISGVPVEGVVTGVNKGGYLVDVSGMSGFCPLGQIDTRRVEDPTTLVGQKLQFRVMEVRGDRDLLVSRRALLEEGQAQKAAETRGKIVIGAKLSGTVTRVLDFGAFVDLGGLEGMVPASELAWGRKRPQDVVNVGQTVDVEVTRIEPSLDHKGRPVEKIGLSMRALARDPFEQALPGLQSGVLLRGIVTRVEAFGAFVELVPAVEGLIHVSAFGRRVTRAADVVQPGQDIAVQVEMADGLSRRIALSYVDPQILDAVLDADRAPPPAVAGLRVVGWARPSTTTLPNQERLNQAPRNERVVAPPPIVGSVVHVTVDKIESFGVFVSWPTGRGLVPSSELGLPYGADLRKLVPAGTEFDALVQDVRPDGKVRLSKAAAATALERAEVDAWTAQQKPANLAESVGSFGELLRQKLNQGKK